MLTAGNFITFNEYLTDIKNLLSTVSFLLKNYSLVKVMYLLTSVRPGYSCVTQIILIEMVLINNTHTHTHTHTPNTQRKTTAERVSYYENK